tara:strand:- start:501 stop:776 length:276 start_codon:yes stop_codon:yes gene_type:complete
MSRRGNIDLDIGDLVRDTVTGQTGVVLEIKKWSYSIDLRDVYVHWNSGENLWASSDDLEVISPTHGVYNQVLRDGKDFLVTILPSTTKNQP